MSGLGTGMVPQLLGCAEGLPAKEKTAGLQLATQDGSQGHRLLGSVLSQSPDEVGEWKRQACHSILNTVACVWIDPTTNSGMPMEVVNSLREGF